MRAFDVSMPLFAGMPAFPGDPVFSSAPDHAIARGDPYNVSALALGSHAGTHVDPPLHFLAGGAGADRLDLGVLNGPAQLVDVDPARRSIGAAEVAAVPDGVERVIFRTANSGRWASRLAFFPDYVALTDAGAAALLERRVRVVGLDALSIEADATGTFPVHHRLLGGGALIVEGLLLASVPAGPCEMVCLPLKIRDGDGAPARVVLRCP
ncbi:MAG TPA: cyclase family protein [Thermoplasmata archaeon]|nr:cyclase family protein [Thermoplasmata archaeon]